MASFLRNNRSVSAVILEHDQFRQEGTDVILSRATEIIANEKARRPVPAQLLERFRVTG